MNHKQDTSRRPYNNAPNDAPIDAAPASTLERSAQKLLVRDQLTSSEIGHAKKSTNIIKKKEINNFENTFMNRTQLILRIT